MNGKIKLYIQEKRIGLIIDGSTNTQYVFFPESLPEDIRTRSLKMENVVFDAIETVHGKQAININLKG